VLGEAKGQTLGKTKTLVRHRQQLNAVVRAEASTIECGSYFLAGNRWKREQQAVTAGHGGRGWREVADRIGIDNHNLR
jgi:hypothetical protein